MHWHRNTDRRVTNNATRDTINYRATRVFGYHAYENDLSSLADFRAAPDGPLSYSILNGDVGVTSGVWYESVASPKLDLSVGDTREPPVDLPKYIHFQLESLIRMIIRLKVK